MPCQSLNTNTYTYKGIQLPPVQKLSKEERETIMVTIVDTLMASGLPDITIEIACAIAGNIRSESTFNYTARNITDEGCAYGLCQWHNNRVERLYKYCKDTGKSPNTVEGQVQYLLYELRDIDYYRKFYDTMITPEYRNDIDKLTKYFCMNFENPGEKYCKTRSSDSRYVYTTYQQLKGKSE